MELVSVNQARALWLFPLVALNPHGIALGQQYSIELGKRYGFATTPTPFEIAASRESNHPLKFLSGAYSPLNRRPVGIDLLIYKDGLVADTRSSTDDSHAFLADVLDWTCGDYGLVDYKTVERKELSISDLRVTSKHELQILNPKLVDFGRQLTSVANIDGANFEISTIGFWADQVLAYQPVPFRFERLIGVKFAENQYTTISPTDTKSHLALLETLEQILKP